jgi:trehalose/maltose hydrolase-like predicted phosphorylase
MGPNEFHEKQPGADDEHAGVPDNAYTNISVVWLLKRTLELVDILPSHVRGPLFEKIAFDQRECERWEHIARRMYVAMSEEGIISQYDGFMQLKKLDWERYKNKYGNIGRIDRILKSEGDAPDNYQVSKQADALMLFYMFPAQEVLTILRELGYTIEDKEAFMQNNYTYYLGCTTHGSSLSKVAHAAMAPDMGFPEKLWDWFMEAVKSDIYDTQGGTTAEAIHTGVMGGTIDIVTRIIGGARLGEDGSVVVRPNLPDHWQRLRFTVAFRGKCYQVTVSHEGVDIQVQESTHNPRIDYSRHARLTTRATP